MGSGDAQEHRETQQDASMSEKVLGEILDELSRCVRSNCAKS